MTRRDVTSPQERRDKERGIEAAKKAVAAAAAEKKKPEPEQVKLAGEKIAKDETEEGQASQECEVNTWYNTTLTNAYQYHTTVRNKRIIWEVNTKQVHKKHELVGRSIQHKYRSKKQRS